MAFKKYIRLYLGSYTAYLTAYDEYDKYTELDQYSIPYDYKIVDEDGNIVSSGETEGYFSDVGELLENELRLSHSKSWPKIASILSSKITESIQETGKAVASLRKDVTYSSNAIWRQEQEERRARRKEEEDRRYAAFVEENETKLREPSPFSQTYPLSYAGIRKQLKGVIIAKKIDGQNVYVLKTATKEIPLIGMTKQIQHAIGMRYDLPWSKDNPFGYTEKTLKNKARDSFAMERGTRIHHLIEQGIKRGDFLVRIQDSERLMQIANSFTGVHGPTKKLDRELKSYRGDVEQAFDEIVRAQEVLELVRENFPAGAGWQIKSEYAVSDYTYYASSVDILAVNKRTKEAVVIDVKTGSKTPVNYVQAQTSSYATLLSRTDTNLKGYDIKTGKIDFSGGTLHTPKLTYLSRLTDDSVDTLLYVRSIDKNKERVGYYNKLFPTVAKKLNTRAEVLPFARENINSIFSLATKKTPNEGDIVVFDLETVPTRNGVSAIRAASILSLTQYRDENGMVRFFHSGKKDELFERTYLSRETFNSTTQLTQDQWQALEENMLTDEVVTRFEKLAGRGAAHIASSKDVLEIMKRMSGKTVIGHNIIDYDLPVLFYTGSYEANLEGGEEARSAFIDKFRDYLSSMNIIDTLDLAKIIQKDRKSAIKNISNSGLAELFSPTTLELLKGMLHQSSADILVTAKNFEMLMNVMSKTERDILFKIIRDKDKFKHSYTVMAMTERWTGKSEQKTGVRFALHHTGNDILGRAPLITSNQWAYIKAKLKKLTEFEKQQLSELLKEESSMRASGDVYLMRKGDTLFFISEADDIENAEKKEKEKKNPLVVAKVTIGEILRGKKRKNETDTTYSGQNYDSVVLSKLGELFMGTDAIDNVFAQTEDTKIVARAFTRLEPIFNMMVKEHYRDASKWELLEKMLGGLSQKDAKYIFRHLNDFRKLYTDSNGVLDTAIDDVVMQGLMSKVGIHEEDIIKKLFEPSTLKFFSSDTQEKRLLNADALDHWIKGLNPVKRIMLEEKIQTAENWYNLLSDNAKAKGKDFGAFIKNSGAVGRAILNSNYYPNTVRNVLQSEFLSLITEPDAPKFASEFDKQKAIYSALVGVPNLDGKVLQNWVKNHPLEQFSYDSSDSLVSLLKGPIPIITKYANKAGLTGTYAEKFQAQLLDEALLSGDIDIPSFFGFADSLLEEQNRAKEVEKENSLRREQEAILAEQRKQEQAAFESWTDPWNVIDRNIESNKQFAARHKAELAEKSAAEVAAASSFMHPYIESAKGWNRQYSEESKELLLSQLEKNKERRNNERFFAYSHFEDMFEKNKDRLAKERFFAYSHFEDMFDKQKRITATRKLARQTDYEAKLRDDAALESARQEYAGRVNDVLALERRNPLMSKGDLSYLLDAASGSAEHFADAIQEVTDRMGKAIRVFGGVTHAMFGVPFYNPERFFNTAYSQIGGIHSSLKGLIPNFMNTSITKMLTGTTQDYERDWLSTKYGLKKADVVMPVIGAVLGAVAGGPNPMSIAFGASLGKGASAIASQFIGLGREHDVEAAGLFFQSRFNKMGAIVTAVTGALGLFAKALKIATVPILGGVGVGLYHYRRALSNMSNFETPLTNLTGISYGNYYQSLERSDLAYGMAKGTTNKIIEGIEFQKQGLFTLGRYDKDKLISAAMLGVLNNAFIPNGRNGAANYASMMNTLYSRMSTANSAEQQRMMYLLNLYNPDMARQIQVRTDITNFLSKQGAGSIYKRKPNYFDITDDQRQEFRAVSFFQGNFADSINKSIMKVALGLYKWKGFDFMNAFTGVIGRAGNYFAEGKYNEGLGEIADGIIRLMKGIGDTWKEVKEKLGVSSISDEIINKAKLIGYRLELVLLDIGDFALDTIEKLQGPMGSLGTLLMKQFSKLFEFVGTLRFDYDLKKLAAGQAGGITPHWGYKISDYNKDDEFSIDSLFGPVEYRSEKDYYTNYLSKMNNYAWGDYNKLTPEQLKTVKYMHGIYLNKYLNRGDDGFGGAYLSENDISVFNKALLNNDIRGQWYLAQLFQTLRDSGFKGSLKDFLETPTDLINGNIGLFRKWQDMFGYTSRDYQNIVDFSNFAGLGGTAIQFGREQIEAGRKAVQGKLDKLVIDVTANGTTRRAATITGEHIQLQEAIDYGYVINLQD